MCLIVPLFGVLGILKNKKAWPLFQCKSLSSYFQYIFAHHFPSKLRKIRRKDKKKINKLTRRKMRDSNARPLILEAGALTTAPWKIFNSVIPFSHLLTNDIYNKFELGQNCVKAIGTPFMPGNNVNT